MKELNICIYSMRSTNGNLSFAFKTRDPGIPSEFSQIDPVAREVARKVNEFLAENSGNSVQVSIDFKPYHDIECFVGILPKHCSPLAPEKEKEFWEKFIAYYKSR